jgi:hypothetical protein
MQTKATRRAIKGKRPKQKLLPCYQALDLEVVSGRVLYPEGQDIDRVRSAQNRLRKAQSAYFVYSESDAKLRHEKLVDRNAERKREVRRVLRRAMIEAETLKLLLRISNCDGGRTFFFGEAFWLFARMKDEIQKSRKLRESHIESWNRFWHDPSDSFSNDIEDEPSLQPLRNFFEAQKANALKHETIAIPEFSTGHRILCVLDFRDFVILSHGQFGEDLHDVMEHEFKDGRAGTKGFWRCPFPPEGVIEGIVANLEQSAIASRGLLERAESQYDRALAKPRASLDRILSQAEMSIEGMYQDDNLRDFSSYLLVVALAEMLNEIPRKGRFSLSDDHRTLDRHEAWFLYFNNLFRLWSDEVPPSDRFKEFLLWHIAHPKWLNKAPGSDCPLPLDQWPKGFIEGWSPVSNSLIGFHPGFEEKHFRNCVMPAQSNEELAFYFASYLRQRFSGHFDLSEIPEARLERILKWNDGWYGVIESQASVVLELLEPETAEFAWTSAEDLAWSAMLEEEKSVENRRQEEQAHWKAEGDRIRAQYSDNEPEEESQTEQVFTCEYVFDVQHFDGRTKTFEFTEDTLKETLEEFCMNEGVEVMVPFSSLANAIFHFLEMDHSCRLAMPKEKNAKGVVWGKMKRDSQRIYLILDDEDPTHFYLHLMRRKDWVFLR